MPAKHLSLCNVHKHEGIDLKLCENYELCLALYMYVYLNIIYIQNIIRHNAI